MSSLTQYHVGLRCWSTKVWGTEELDSSVLKGNFPHKNIVHFCKPVSSGELVCEVIIKECLSVSSSNPRNSRNWRRYFRSLWEGSLYLNDSFCCGGVGVASDLVVISESAGIRCVYTTTHTKDFTDLCKPFVTLLGGPISESEEKIP